MRGKFAELTYASPNDPKLKRWIKRFDERFPELTVLTPTA